jgi:hypothetical protein
MKRPAPIEDPEDVVAAESKRVKRIHRSLKHLKSRRKMSMLERLPTELLERVFLFSMNLDLPRTSPILAGKLSSDYVYTRTVMNAFDSVWSPQYEWLKYGNDEEGPKFDDMDANLQSAILRCRWASLGIMRRAEETWLLNTAMGREPPIEIPDDVMEAMDIRQQLFRHRATDDLFESDYTEFRIYTETYDWQQGLPEWRWKTPYFKFHPKLQIPNELLHGPWDEERLKWLFYFARAGINLDWVDSTSGEEALSGLYEAVRTGNLYALSLLLSLSLEEHIPSDLVNWSIRTTTTNRKQIMHFLKPFMDRLGHTEKSQVRKEVSRFRAEALTDGSEEKRDMVEITRGVWELS